MTNRNDEKEPAQDCNRRVAALTAVHLVSQVLDEAYIVANEAQQSGHPWNYVSMLNDVNDKNLDSAVAVDEDEMFEASMGDNVNENNVQIVANIIATSTPEKNSAKEIDCSGVTLMPSFNDSTLIGQGDEEIETEEDTTNSTSMFINQLFNMSEVEQVIFCGSDDSDVVQTMSETKDLVPDTINKIINPVVELSDVMSSFNPFSNSEECSDMQNEIGNIPTEMLPNNDYSEYSFLSDAFIADIGRDVTFYIEEGPSVKHEVYECQGTETVERVAEFQQDVKNADESGKKAIEQQNNFQLFENAYATMNRDYDHCSEEDGYPILQDPKEMMLQEVELISANTSDDEAQRPKANSPIQILKPKDEAEVSAISGSGRSTLARRCRFQGAKLFACIRGWWRRKTPAKFKNPTLDDTLCLPRLRSDESKRLVHPVCPLSPDARRRASSLLDHRRLRSPSPSRPVVWKFNTVNEVLVNSNRWKDYTFDSTAEGCADI